MSGIGEKDVTEDDLKLWLVGEEGEAKRAIACIHNLYGAKILGHLNHKLPWIGLELKKSAMSRTYEELWTRARDGRFDINLPLGGLIFKIAHRKAIDLIRGETRKKRTLPDPEFHEELAKAIHGGSFDHKWQMIEVRELASKVMEEFRQWMGTLKGQQIRIAHMLAEGFPDILSASDIHKKMLDTDPTPPTYEAVKRTRGLVSGKFKEHVDWKYEEIWK